MFERLKKTLDLLKPHEASSEAENSFEEDQDGLLDEGSSIRYTRPMPKIALESGEFLKELESIYTLEKVDVSTVRPLKLSSETPSDSVTPFCVEKNKDAVAQENHNLRFKTEFDFGLSYASTLPSFKLIAPIEVLKLSSQALNVLHEHQKKTIQDLVNTKSQDYVFFKGMGQGHIDALKKSLEDYLKEDSLYQSEKIDLISIIRALSGDIDAKSRYCLLDHFKLTHLFSWSEEEKALVKHLTKVQKEEFFNKGWKLLTHESKVLRVKLWMQEISQAYVIPWLRRRNGIAQEYEILERIYSLVEDQEGFRSHYQLLQQAYFGDGNPFTSHLLSIDQKCFFSDLATKQDAEKVIKKAMTYFYKCSVCYLLHDLVSFIEREFARDWTGYPQGFVQKVLQTSGTFRVRKKEKHQLFIYLANTLV